MVNRLMVSTSVSYQLLDINIGIGIYRQHWPYHFSLRHPKLDHRPRIPKELHLLGLLLHDRQTVRISPFILLGANAQLYCLCR